MSDASDYFSATCQICGTSFDFCLITTSREDVGIACCEKRHNFCAKHCKDAKERLKKKAMFDEDETIQEADYLIDNISCAHCPVCEKKNSKNFTEELTDQEVIAFFLKENGITKQDLLKLLKERFANGKEFSQYIE